MEASSANRVPSLAPVRSCRLKTDCNTESQSKSLPHGDRLFYQLPEPTKDSTCFQEVRLQSENVTELLDYIENNVMGSEFVYSGPWGLRKNVYCDYIASARSLQFIEDYIQQNVLPVYANTHTTTTVTSLQTTLYRHEARDIVRNAVKASEHDAVIFVGSGCTGAIHKLINGLDLKQPPVVLFGPYEHHSNLLPWRELGALMVSIPEDQCGVVDINALERELMKWQTSEKQLIGCFSAASNITGILADTVAITTCLHRFGALAFWDYATAAPYVDIDMNPVIASCADQSLASKDAIYLSPHKFVGGVETPGILVAKKKLFDNPIPSEGGGGGSVFFVTRDDHRYLQQVEMREEPGTPSIVGAIRAGMVFQLKQAIGSSNIMEREHRLCRKAVEFWSSSPSLLLLGNPLVPRLSIFSFLIRHQATGQFLHHNFVCAVLNDVFGIQTRGGCACAGPYAQSLLGIDQTLANRIEAMLLEDSRLDRVHLRRYHEYSDREILRPGFTRLNLPYFMNDECVDFVLSAVAMVAEHGWKLLPQYTFNPETGEWKQKNHKVFQDRRWLGSISYTSGKMKFTDPPTPKSKGAFPQNYTQCLAFAEDIFQKAEKTRIELADQSVLFDGEAGALRWFMLPSEAQMLLSNRSSSNQTVKKKMPLFEPRRFRLTSEHKLVDDTSNASTCMCDMKGDLDHCKKPDDANSSQPISCALDQQWTDTHIFQSSTEHGYIGEKADGELCESKDVCFQVPLFANVNKSASQKMASLQNGGEDSNVLDVLEEQCGLKSVVVSNSKITQGKNEQESFSDAISEACFSSPAVGEVITSKEKQSTTLSELSQTTESSKTKFDIVDSILDEKDKRAPLCDVKPTEMSKRTSSGIKTICSGKHRSVKAKDVHSKTTDPLPAITMPTKTLTSIPMQTTDTVKSNNDTSLLIDMKLDEINPKVSGTDDIGESVCELRHSGKTECLPCMRPRCKDPDAIPRIKSDASEHTVAVKFHAPPKKIFKPTLQALEEYQMVHNGDRVLVCLSGGKDSLSLLHTLRQYQFVAKKKGIHFDLGAVTVDPQTSSYDPSPLKGYLKSLGLPYFYEEQRIIEQAASLENGCDSICSFCSRLKRGRLYACARREEYNVLAMGQHLDDLTESFMMSVFHNGLLRTMKANYLVKEGDLRVIRPFVYVREKHLREFAEQSKLPVIPENCPACFEAPKERHRTKQLLAGQELLFPQLYSSLQTALKPLMAKNKTGLESSLNKKPYPVGSIGEEDDI